MISKFIRKRFFVPLLIFAIIPALIISLLRPSFYRGQNIFFIVLDTLRKDRFSFYGSAEKYMPFVDEAAGKGVIFQNFYSNASHTLPSHFSMFSSRLPTSKNMFIRNSFVEQLKKLGYRTYGISANNLLSRDLNFHLGFDFYDADIYKQNMESEDLRKKFDEIEKNFRHNNPFSPYMRIYLATTGDIVNGNIFRTLDQHIINHKNKKFFFFVNYLDPHDPYFPHTAKSNAQEINYNIRDDNASLIDFWTYFHDLRNHDRAHVAKRYNELYNDELFFVDQCIQALVEKLERDNLLDDTVFIITSDHGEILGEHGLFTHNLGLYDEEVEVPFLIIGKGMKTRNVRAYFSHLNSGEIVLALAKRGQKRFLDNLRNRTPIAHEHILFDESESVLKNKLDFLPPWCKVNLFRLTYERENVYYFSKDGEKNIEVYDYKDADLKNNLFLSVSNSDRLKYLKKVNKFSGRPDSYGELTKEQVKKLKTLGYINN